MEKAKGSAGGSVGHMIGPCQCLQMCVVNLLATKAQSAGCTVKGIIVIGFTRPRQIKQIAKHACVLQQRLFHWLRYVQQAQCCLHGHTQHGIEQRKNSYDKSLFSV